MKVLVLAGGRSNERAVSLRSGAKVAEALKSKGHDVVRADPADEGFDLDTLARTVDVVFPALHGEGGEDGSLQLALEEVGVAFVGSGSRASQLTYDKHAYKEFLRQKGIATPNSEVVTAESVGRSALITQPFVIKQIDGGSSIDTFIVRDTSKAPNYTEAFERHTRMLLEELIEGPELTVGVLGKAALPVVLILPPEGKEFDYENKYNGASKEIVSPAQIASEVQIEAQGLAADIHSVTGCRHLSRTDIIIASSGELMTLETNTIPGLTGESLYPKAAAAAGLEMPELMQQLIELAVAG